MPADISNTVLENPRTLRQIIEKYPEYADIPIYVYDGSDRENVMGENISLYTAEFIEDDISSIDSKFTSGIWLCFSLRGK